MNKHAAVCLIVLSLSLGCSPLHSESGYQEEAPQAATRTPPATSFRVPSLAPATILPTVATSPPLPNFDEALTFGGAGGGLDLCGFDDYKGPIPAVKGSLDFHSYLRESALGMAGLLRLARLCLWGIAIDQPFSVSLTSSDGSHTLHENFNATRASTGVEAWSWPDDTRKIPAGGLEFWWPGDLPSGVWKVVVAWQGGSVAGEFDSGNKSLPEIFLDNGKAGTQLMPPCHPASDQSEFQAVGQSFPVDTQTYILLYEQRPSPYDVVSEHFKLVWSSNVRADDKGNFRLKLAYDFKSRAKYQLIGVTDASTSVTSLIDSARINAFDCFVAPIKPSLSSCPGAPPQQLVITQFGHVCTRKDWVKLREAPGLSAPIIGPLFPADYFVVVDGPRCMDKQSWWQIDTGSEAGWVSEGGDAVDPYFVCPGRSEADLSSP